MTRASAESHANAADSLTLCACHIPKTGGTSVGNWLRMINVPRHVRLVREPMRLPIPIEHYPVIRDLYFYARSIDSHCLRAVPQSVWPGSRFLIVLREPVEWLISYYYFRRLGKELELERWAPHAKETWMTHNFPPLDDVVGHLANYFTRFLAWESLLDPMSSEAPSHAHRELERYSYVATMEDLDHLPSLLATEFPELALRPMHLDNVNPVRDRGEAWSERVSATTLARIRDATRHDIELYEAALRRPTLRRPTMSEL